MWWHHAPASRPWSSPPGGLAAGQLLHAQPKGIKQTLLRKTDLAGIIGRKAVIGLAEIAPGAAARQHYYDGDALGYVLEGMVALEVEGMPPTTLKAGDTYHVEAKRAHDAMNTGTSPAKVLAIYSVSHL
jgi:quercetin dioxygenase-like cupin family protein